MFSSKQCPSRRCHRPMGHFHQRTVIIKPVTPTAPYIPPPNHVSSNPQPPVYYDREPPPAYDYSSTHEVVSSSPPSYDNQVYDWVHSGNYSQVPPKAVEVGTDVDGSKIYVGRARYLSDELPCKVIPRRRQAYVSYDGKEHEVSDYDVMVERKLVWVRSSHGSVPHGAIAGGHTSSGEILYIGRVHHGGAVCLGKVHPSHRCLYIPYGGQEISYRDYEVLTTQ